MKDTIRLAIARRARKLGWTAYRIGKETGIDPGTIKRYLSGYSVGGERRHIALNSRNLSKVMKAMGLEVREK